MFQAQFYGDYMLSNLLIIGEDRWRVNGQRLIPVMDFVVVKLDDGTFRMHKNRFDGTTPLFKTEEELEYYLAYVASKVR